MVMKIPLEKAILRDYNDMDVQKIIQKFFRDIDTR